MAAARPSFRSRSAKSWSASAVAPRRPRAWTWRSPRSRTRRPESMRGPCGVRAGTRSRRACGAPMRAGAGRLKALRSDPSDEAVHELRKRVKDLWYHLRLLRNAWPGALDEAAEQAHEISALLGDHRDLAMLAERARRSAALSDRDLESLEARIGAAQEELLSAAGPIARRLYAEEPKAFTRRLGIYWKEWRG
ncbi:MAG TPA: CHAD domain-containing protein [Solirubrobacterales bacterium]|nr:CHAD domain-containing protein [Solirubrobacterales bacterium]